GATSMSLSSSSDSRRRSFAFPLRRPETPIGMAADSFSAYPSRYCRATASLWPYLTMGNARGEGHEGPGDRVCRGWHCLRPLLESDRAGRDPGSNGLAAQIGWYAGAHTLGAKKPRPCQPDSFSKLVDKAVYGWWTVRADPISAPKGAEPKPYATVAPQRRAPNCPLPPPPR